MFSKSKARRSEAHRASTLARFEQLADDEREDFAYELILTRDHDLALHLLLRMLDDEVSPPVRASLVESLETVLRNARRLLTEVEDDVLREGASSPRALLSAWNAWRGGLAARVGQSDEQPDCHDFEALYEDLRHQQRWLTDVGVTPPPSLNAAPPPADIGDVARAIGALAATVARHGVFADWDEEARRAAVRETLARAGEAPPHSDERADLLLALLPDEDAPRWTDQRDVDLALRETLSHAETDPLLTAHGLVTLLSAPHHVRVAEVRTVLDTLTSAPNVGPHTMSWALVGYEALAVGDQLEDFSYGWFLGLLRHPEPQVRETALTVIGELPRSGEEEAETVGELVRVLEDLEDGEERDTIRAAAAHALGALVPSDPAQTRVIGRALGDHAWDHVPEVRVEYLRYVLSRHDDSALPDLLEELARPDVSAAYLSLVQELRCAPVTRCAEREWWDHVDHFVQARQALEHVTALADQGWAELPDAHHTAEERADILDLATFTLKQALGEPT